MKRGLLLLPMLLAACNGSLLEGGGLGGPLGRFGHTLSGKPLVAPATVPPDPTPPPHPAASLSPTPVPLPTPSPSVAPTASPPTPDPIPDPTPTPTPSPSPSPSPTPYQGPYVTTMHDDWGYGPATFLPGLFGVAHDRAGGTYFVDKTNQVRRFVFDGQSYATQVIAGAPEAGWVDASGTDARFDWPHGLALDGSGFLYVADSGNHRIRRIDSSGRVLTIAGNGTAGYVNAPGTSAQLAYPTGVAVGGDGTVYIADFGNHAIRTIGRYGGDVGTLAGAPVAGYVDAAGDQARFAKPVGVAVAGDRHVFVADSDNHCIREITPAGDVTTLAGNGTPGRQDGVGTAARFNGPRGITLEASGSLLVADSNNHQIRRVFRNGRVITVMGTGRVGAANSRDPLLADFSRPSGVTADPTGKVWIADTENDRIRLYFPGKPPDGNSGLPF